MIRTRFLRTTCWPVFLAALLGLLLAVTPGVAEAQSQVEVCHLPPGNPGNYHTLRIGADAQAAHLAHGDLAGACAAQCGVLCNDGNACTTDQSTWNAAVDRCSCSAVPVVCTASDQCHDAGVCNPATGACSSTPRADGTACGDGNACTGLDTCHAGLCIGADPVLCGALDQCHIAGACDPATGACSNPVAPDGTACLDADLCSQIDICQNGTCVGSNPVCPEPDSCGATQSTAGASCKAILLDASCITPDGIYWIDPNGGATSDAFEVYCDMTTAGGGWTLITSINDIGYVVEVWNDTLITPETGNYTNRNMQLSGVSEILIVADGKDAGFDTTFDKAELYSGVTGISLNWQQILDALNKNTGATWSDRSYSVGVDDAWQFAVMRVNTTGCLQALLRGAYGDGNYGAFNEQPVAGRDVAPIGMLYHHWGAETWLSGGYASSGDNHQFNCNQNQRQFSSFWRGLYLR